MTGLVPLTALTSPSGIEMTGFGLPPACRRRHAFGKRPPMRFGAPPALPAWTMYVPVEPRWCGNRPPRSGNPWRRPDIPDAARCVPGSSTARQSTERLSLLKYPLRRRHTAVADRSDTTSGSTVALPASVPGGQLFHPLASPRRGVPSPLRSACAVSHDLDGLSLSRPSGVFQPVTLLGFVCRERSPSRCPRSPKPVARNSALYLLAGCLDREARPASDPHRRGR
jgi:hypothetical protein